ncbi:MAG: helix-turn-helix transcriptional regulator [Rhodospirillales bacterium]|nr:helix-turn-helix transcriptional regulator [Rhodospirillales bacterium]MBN8907756.1 helix-turn-helix transcriptional regulator [Rhodospirillales bacterium]MBN8925068.1 helix-turn-helix transcriptional regulator [Rhodospirillales bacterium]
MAKGRPSTSSRSSRFQSDRKVRSPPLIAQAPKEGRAGKHPSSPDAEICAAGEESQLEFQRIFGVNLRSARLKSGLKQSEVAIITGLTQQYLSLIEAGQQNLTIRTMAILAKVVDHDLLDLLKKVVDTPPKPE